MRIGMGISLSSIGSVASGPFSPPDSANLAAWWEPSKPAQVTAAGGFASSVANSQGDAGALVQATGTKQPGYGSTTINGLNVLHQAGSRLMTATLAAGLGDYHVMMVVRANSYPAATYNALASFGNFAPCLYVNNAGHPDYYFPSDHVVTDLTMATGGGHIIEFWRSGVNIFASIDGVDSSLNPIGSTNAATLANFAILSSNQTGQEFGDFDIGDGFLWKAAQSTGNRSLARNYLKARFATP